MLLNIRTTPGFPLGNRLCLSEPHEIVAVRRVRQPWHIAHRIFVFPNRSDCVTVAVASPAIPKKGHDHDYPVGWCLNVESGSGFAFNLPVSLRDLSTAAEGLGFTQDSPAPARAFSVHRYAPE